MPTHPFAAEAGLKFPNLNTASPAPQGVSQNAKRNASPATVSSLPRRHFLKTATIAGTGMLLPGAANQTAVFADMEKAAPLFIACNAYSVKNILSRDGIDYDKDLGKAFDVLKSVGIDGLEPTVGGPDDLDRYATPLKDRAMNMRTLYVGVNLHDADKAEAEVQRIAAIAEKAVSLGVETVVFNPAAKKGKSDEELIRQSEQVNTLGERLRKIGARLAFHYHTTELEFAAREFYHLLLRTDPANMGLCFEMQWSYRASANSAVAVFDHLRLFRDRVSVLHLRQSRNGIWSECFGDGDIDTPRIARELRQAGLKPQLVLEQASENGTPRDLSGVEVLRRSVGYIAQTFAVPTKT